MIEKMLEDLNVSIMQLDATMRNLNTTMKSGGNSAKSAVTEGVIEEEEETVSPGPTINKKKKATRKKKSVRAVEADDDFGEGIMSEEELLREVGALVQPLGPLSSKIGDFLKKLEGDYEKLSDVPEDERAVVLAKLTKYQRKLMASMEVAEEEDDFLG